MKLYSAFGFTILSDFSIAQLPETKAERYDILIRKSDLSDILIGFEQIRFIRNEVHFSYENVGSFRITNGNLIEVDPDPVCAESHLGVYIMGSCMGAILHQRGLMPIHGSCVTDGKRSILITGDSGAGKSTLAAEFLRHGWKLLTDDVSAVFNVEGTPMVQSSYPSQKLWQDAMERYEKDVDNVHSLYFSENREKFGVNVADSFHEGTCPLSMVIRLLPADAPCSVSPIDGMTKVDQLLRNTYRSFMIAPKDRSRHFQRCVTLSTKVPMAVAIRENGKQCADTIYELITKYLEEQYHD